MHAHIITDPCLNVHEFVCMHVYASFALYTRVWCIWAHRILCNIISLKLISKFRLYISTQSSPLLQYMATAGCDITGHSFFFHYPILFPFLFQYFPLALHIQKQPATWLLRFTLAPCWISLLVIPTLPFQAATMRVVSCSSCMESKLAHSTQSLHLATLLFIV